jgi:hypothetical protein
LASNPEKFNDDLLKFQKDVQFIRSKIGPKATIMAGNRVLRAATTIAVRNVVKELSGKGYPEVKQKHVRARMKVRNMSLQRPFGRMTAYVQDMPAIHLSLGKHGVAKGKKLYRESVKYNAKKPGKNTAIGGSYSKVGGVKVGGRFFPNAFVNVIRKNQTVHILRRKQKATWSGKTRLPIDVIKYPMRNAFAVHFERALLDSIDQNYQKEFDLAYRLEQGRLLGTI